MRLEQQSHLEPSAEFKPTVEARGDTGDQLVAAREADAVWRAERTARFVAHLAWLQNQGGHFVQSFVIMAGLFFGLGIAIGVQVMFSVGPAVFEGPTGFADLAKLLRSLGLSLGISLALAGVALATHRLTGWLDSRFREQANSAGIELNEGAAR